jgi:hypothetical protein
MWSVPRRNKQGQGVFCSQLVGRLGWLRLVHWGTVAGLGVGQFVTPAVASEECSHTECAVDLCL